jgi:hypothetical protein
MQPMSSRLKQGELAGANVGEEREFRSGAATAFREHAHFGEDRRRDHSGPG